jgi:dienelactone hydrolase
VKRILILLVLASQLFATASFAADYAREKKWADEIVPGLVVGDAVYLKQANRHEFLALYTPASGAKSAVIVVHGIGIHPDWGLIGTLRVDLADRGYTTLSVQMPILRNEAKDVEYPPTFPEAAERLKIAVDFLKSKGYSSIAIVSHSLGSRMSYAYLAGKPDPAVKVWVTLGISTVEKVGALKLPVFDLYGERDLPKVVANAEKRKQALAGKADSRQQMIAGADHFFDGKEAEMVNAVYGFLKESLGN